MNLPAEQLEFVVREVLRRLAVESPSSSNSSSPAQLLMEQRVVTTAAFDGRLTGVSRVIVDPNAIVTPAVVDLLKDNSIELVRGNVAEAITPSARQSVLLVSEKSNTGTLASQLQANGASVRTEMMSNHRGLGGMLAPNEVGVVLASKPFEAACHANRDTQVCAVHVTNSEQCSVALKEVNANVLVVDAKRVDVSLISTFLNATQK